MVLVLLLCQSAHVHQVPKVCVHECVFDFNFFQGLDAFQVWHWCSQRANPPALVDAPWMCGLCMCEAIW